MERGFHAYEAALQLVGALQPIHDAVRLADRDLADQLRPAGVSVLLNLAEGAGRAGRDRLHCYRIAPGSAREVGAALAVARAWGLVGACSEVVDGVLDRVLAMLWRLTHPRAGP
ncbi:MAG: four helix bundle protein [Acidobacteria bacterium]|nr:four helix bundle protein [Acidobacteriota bacterium]